MVSCKTGSLKSSLPPPSRSTPLTLILVLFIIVDIGLLLFGLSSPFGGFHGLQEAWYSAIAKNYSSHSLLMPTTYDNRLDLNVPPLLSYFVWLSFSVLRPTELAARLVPVCFALLSLAGVYLLGRLMFRKDAGLEAAALFASTPIFLILGRNVQTEILFVALSLFFLYFYLKANRSGRRSDIVLAGLFLGAALFSKQFAVLPLIALILWELLGSERRRLVRRDFVLFLLIGGCVLVPFYGYHLLHDPAYLLHAQLHGSASRASLASGFTLSFLVSEIFWGCSPLLLIGGLAGLGLALRQRERYGALAGLVIGCFFVFYLFLHKHSYYFFGMVPFLALCFTDLAERMPAKVYAAGLTVTLLTATLLAAYQLAGCKYGFDEFKQLSAYINSCKRPVIMVDRSFYYRPLFKYYSENVVVLLRNSDLSPSEKESLRSADKVFSFSVVPLSGAGAEIIPIKGVRYGLRLGGRIYVHTPPNEHFFTPSSPIELKDCDVIRSFGPFVKIERTSFYLIAGPPM